MIHLQRPSSITKVWLVTFIYPASLEVWIWYGCLLADDVCMLRIPGETRRLIYFNLGSGWTSLLFQKALPFLGLADIASFRDPWPLPRCSELVPFYFPVPWSELLFFGWVTCSVVNSDPLGTDLQPVHFWMMKCVTVQAWAVAVFSLSLSVDASFYWQSCTRVWVEPHHPFALQAVPPCLLVAFTFGKSFCKQQLVVKSVIENSSCKIRMYLALVLLGREYSWTWSLTWQGLCPSPQQVEPLSFCPLSLIFWVAVWLGSLLAL